MNKIDYQALREAAEKATPGPWEYYPGNTSIEYNVDSMVEDQGSIVYVDSGDFTQKQTDLNGAFIAAANPATVLALLDERERNLQYIKRRDQENEDIALTVGRLRVELEAAEKRIAELDAREISLPERSSMLHRTDFHDDYQTVMAYKVSEVIAAIRAAGIRIKGE
ncbi:ead/Ea22-like family protein [Escherichia coli]|nr:ead/Ea22-like family protein [Escherichia coli]